MLTERIKKLSVILMLVVMTLAITTSCSSTETKLATENVVVVDGVTYTLSDDWSYDEEEKTFSNTHNDDYYVISDAWDDNACTSSEERKATFASDGSDGFDVSELTVNDGKALLVCEPVNEIKDYHVFFYANGVEHILNFETAFEEELKIDNLNDFLSMISFT